MVISLDVQICEYLDFLLMERIFDHSERQISNAINELSEVEMGMESWGGGGDVESFLTQPVASIDVMNNFAIKISCANQ